MRRRTSLIALTTIVLGSAATACSSDGTAAPSGDWRREDDGDLLVAIPKKWERSSPEEGAWTTRWTDPDNDQRSRSSGLRVWTLMVAPMPPSSTSACGVL